LKSAAAGIGKGLSTVTSLLGGVTKALGVLGVVGAASFAGIGLAAAGLPLLIGAVGIAAAAQAQEVKDAFSGLAEDVKSGLQEAAAPLVPVLTSLAGTLGSAFQQILP